jgi:hypothetical protein
MIRAGKHGTKKIINKEGNKMKDFLWFFSISNKNGYN